jgi:hypothetical protein
MAGEMASPRIDGDVGIPLETACRPSRMVLSRPLLCRFVPAVAIICVLAWCFISIRSNFSWDDSEPEILNQAWRLARGESIYHGIDSPPYAFAPYPPVYFAIVAGILKLTGLSFLPAKMVSFLAALAICGALIYLSRAWSAQSRSGVWTCYLLFLIPAFLYNALRSQVQMLAVAFSIWSLVLFMRNRRFETLVFSPLLAALAFYTKQTQIALPAAMAVYLLIRNRRWFLPYLSVLALAGSIPFIWLQRVSRGSFFLDTVQLARLSYDVRTIPQIFLHHAGPVAIFLVIALCLVYRRFRSGIVEPVDLYFICVFFVTLISLGRIGAHGQYVLELLVVTMVYLLRTTNLPEINGQNLWVSVQVFLLLLYAPAFVFLEEGLWDITANRASEQIYSVIRGQSGPVLSQQGSFALFGRGEIYIQLFHFTGLSRSGAWDQSRILDEISNHKFSYVITEFPVEKPAMEETSRERFTPEMISALRKNYRRANVVNPYFVYTPAR